MIRELRIKNLALIDDCSLTIHRGFSVFTGETGSGKSILIGAIGLLLGERASNEMIRSGCNEAEVNGVFSINNGPQSLVDQLLEQGISCEDDTLIIRRILALNGKNRILVNQVPLPLAALKKIGDLLIDFHGQHEHQSLLLPETAQHTIDSLESVASVKTIFDEAFAAYHAAQTDLAAFNAQALDIASRKDILTFQKQELEALHVTLGEEERLLAELNKVTASTERIEAVSAISTILSDDSLPISETLVKIRKKIELLSRHDTTLTSWISELEIAITTIDELETFCGSYLDTIAADADPTRIETINSRLAKIQRFKKKYQTSEEGLIALCKDRIQELSLLENTESDKAELEKKFERMHADCLKHGEKLRVARAKAAQGFDSAVTTEMNRLGFTAGALKTLFTPYANISPTGLDECSFLVRTNAGEEFLPLVKTASGGEISRIMLAIKTALKGSNPVHIMIFDEIDTGIGGLIAHEVAVAMKELSISHQVLCISHLHQIASVADTHYTVYKETLDKRTVTRVVELNHQGRIDEISRMLGGDSLTARKHATELLKK